MRTIAEPDLDAEAVFSTISAARRPLVVRERLAAAQPQVFDAYRAYAGASVDVTALAPADTLPATAADLRGNYTSVSQAGQFARNRILGSNADGTCPLCGEAPASTLDHYLPRGAFPEFSVLPLNLVPACYDCNVKKGSNYNDGNGALFLHAYLDDLPTDEPFLVADVEVTGEDIVSTFRVVPPASTTPVLRRRIASHFERLGLRDYYAFQAAKEAGERRGAIASLLEDGGGPAGVRDYLLNEFDSVAQYSGPSHWRAALLRAMAASDDVCSGAFLTPRDP